MKVLRKDSLYFFKFTIKRTEKFIVAPYNIYLSSVSFKREYILIQDYMFAAFGFSNEELLMS